jgi:cystathionine beta-lyase family protein involved in aluminum resistance
MKFVEGSNLDLGDDVEIRPNVEVWHQNIVEFQHMQLPWHIDIIALIGNLLTLASVLDGERE